TARVRSGAKASPAEAACGVAPDRGARLVRVRQQGGGGRNGEQGHRRRRKARHGSAGPRLHVRLELLRPRRPPLGGPLDGSQGPAATAAAVEAASGRASFPRRSPLDERSQAPEGIVPLLRDSVQVSARLLETPRRELPDALASATFAAHETRSGERMKVLRDGLARDGIARAQADDGVWSLP